MRLLISDANILIDMEAGALMETLFRLPMQFGIPDLLYYEEIEEGSPGLEQLGLQIMEVSGDFVKYAEKLPSQYNGTLPAKNGAKPSHNDYLALALAKQESCTLLTGDANLRIVAEEEQVVVMGTIGLLCAMVKNRLISVDDAFVALNKMKEGKRRPEATLVMQGGEVSVEQMTSLYGNELFLFSAIARPGNSGGPILSESGHAVGIVTQELSERDSQNHPFHAGIATATLAQAIHELDCGVSLPVETWQ